MSVVSLLGVKILNNPAKFGDPYNFEITFECLEPLREDVEWRLTYVGSATSNEFDQELDSLLVGPIPVGVNKFVFEAQSPDIKRIPDSEVLGVTVILLTGSYADREFVRVGYYVNNEYDADELNSDPPAKPLLDRVRRNILAEKPRVTRFAIRWDSDASAPPEFPPEQPEADVEADGDQYGAEEEEDEDDEEGPAEGGDVVEADPDVMVDDLENTAAVTHEEETGDESEDLEGESDGSEADELEEDDEDDVEADDSMIIDGALAKNGGVNNHHMDEVMAH